MYIIACIDVIDLERCELTERAETAEVGHSYSQVVDLDFFKQLNNTV
jgi:hypothetical protein